MAQTDEKRKVPINRLITGVPGLDEALGGGLPEYSFNLIAGPPGAGKTTLVQQMMFTLATPERPALYFTLVGEPTLKMLRYQQQFAFFDHAKVNSSIRFINLSQEALEAGLRPVLETIVREVESANPGLVIVDSFRSVVRVAGAGDSRGMALDDFVQRLALHLTAWQATTFLVGEYQENELQDNPVFTVADGILWLTQNVDRNSIVRKCQVVKMRGQAPLPGLHTLRITGAGVHVFPRILRRSPGGAGSPPERRLSLGTPELDAMLGGGIPAWNAVLVAGPSGSGKTALAAQFIAEGLKRREPGVVAVFEERPREYLRRAQALGLNMEEMIRDGLLEVLYLRPLDLSVDEALLEIEAAVARVKAQRLVIDSLSGFELALAPTFREDFRESLYRMVGAITSTGVTVLMTAEVAESFSDLRFSPDLVSFLTDDIILQRYVEMDGRLRKVMTVVKMRGSPHSTDLRTYEITDTGLVVGETLSGYTGIIRGVAHRVPADALSEPGSRNG